MLWKSFRYRHFITLDSEHSHNNQYQQVNVSLPLLLRFNSLVRKLWHSIPRRLVGS